MRAADVALAGWEGVPGVVGPGGYLEGLYRYYPRTIPGPVFSHILEARPYLRPNEGLLCLIYEVSQIWPQMGPDMASELTQN